MCLRCLCARCACALVPDHEHASAKVDESIRQEHAGSHVPAAFLVPLDALESRGKDDCLRTPPLCARVSNQLGSSKVFSGLSVNVDFLVGESDDLLAAEQSMHLEGKTKNNARGCEIATCAAVGAEIQTCIRWWVQAVHSVAGRRREGGIHVEQFAGSSSPPPLPQIVQIRTI